jgi:hypothetical protein
MIIESKRLVQTSLDWSLAGLQFLKILMDCGLDHSLSLDWSSKILVLIGYGPVQSRSFSGLRTRLPSTNRKLVTVIEVVSADGFALRPSVILKQRKGTSHGQRITSAMQGKQAYRF